MPTWALHVDADLDEVNRHWAALDAAGMLAAAEVDDTAIIYFARRPDDPPLDGRLEHIADRDWHERWRDGLTPIRAGRWTVTPSWLATGGTDELLIDPGQAFGTGHHETTVGCLEALDALSLRGRTVLDVGTGTGVLAIAAARAGAVATAVDVDPLATTAASDNARRNRVSIAVVTGTLDRVAGRTFDVVVANLDSAMLIAAAGGLARVVAPDGVLVASGVSNPRSDEVAGALTAVGLSVEVSTGHEWSLLRARRTDG
ncbi:MAG: 50S ribosomal protein L11 methyltransferase [Actinobacteria bacterium]|nr:50S ribosomal protein L11 methyltransferase [Actinomycetota bacterium]